jgi:tetratricopeptide (TPR) repeat protein
METTLEELEAHVKDVRTKLEEAMATEATQQQLLGMALEGGCHGMALRLLERDRTALADNLPLMLTYAELLMINGRTEEAWESLEGFERRFPGAIVPPQDLPNFQRWCYQCAVANAVALDLKRSTELLERSAAGQNNSLARGFMEMPLMAYSVPPQTDLGVPLLGTLVADMFLRRNGAWDQTMFDLARLQWEYGDAEAAAATLNELLNAHPDTPLRPLVAWMLVVITEKPVDPEAPFEKIPVTPDMFAPED